MLAWESGRNTEIGERDQIAPSALSCARAWKRYLSSVCEIRQVVLAEEEAFVGYVRIVITRRRRESWSRLKAAAAMLGRPTVQPNC